ncbi:MAG: hydrogenase nickel incorporation protein HypA [Halochromatium sp.]|nr:hydrogenase nickel incorporation protein HypA [Halochromatium sp.]
MHELSVCMSLLEQVERIAREHGAERVERILLRIGPLSGVEAALLANAYPLAAAGSIAEHARLDIEPAPVRVHCIDCGQESEASPNRLLCLHCGSYHTKLSSGDEMLLASLEMSIPEEPSETQEPPAAPSSP